MRSLDKSKLRRWFTDGAARTRPPCEAAPSSSRCSAAQQTSWPLTVRGQASIWGGVERLAKVLYRRRYLSPRAVKKVLGMRSSSVCGDRVASRLTTRVAKGRRRSAGTPPHSPAGFFFRVHSIATLARRINWGRQGARRPAPTRSAAVGTLGAALALPAGRVVSHACPGDCDRRSVQRGEAAGDCCGKRGVIYKTWRAAVPASARRPLLVGQG
jgi:hypothetical protein